MRGITLDNVMPKKIIIHPCKNQSEMIDIAKNYIGDNPILQCKSNGYHGMVAIMRDNKYVGSVQESSVSIIFKGIEDGRK